VFLSTRALQPTRNATLCITADSSGRCLSWVIRVVAGQSRP
jgi:hypothetical protein